MMPIRHETIMLLQLKPGDTVLDVASGTGLSFALLVEAVGSSGQVVAIEHSPEMMALARQRVQAAGWQNVTLIEAQVEKANIPTPLDAVLFHFTHDVLQSREALDNIFSAAKTQARVAVAGAKLTSWWLAPLNLWVLWRARRYLTTYDHLKMPWYFLAHDVPDITVEPRLFHTGYVGHGIYTKDVKLAQSTARNLPTAAWRGMVRCASVRASLRHAFLMSAAVFMLFLSACATIKPVAAPFTVEEPRFEASRLAPARWALVLSSGSLRGYAHIGVLRALEAEGLKPDLIVGSSAGALVGAMSASGASSDDIDHASAKIGPDLLMDWTFSRTGLLGGSRIHSLVDAHVHRHRIDEFPIRFAAVAVEAERGCLQVFNAGDVGKAVQASSTVPVVIAPPTINGKHYFDGALASPLPVRIARALGAERVVAINVTFDPKERRFTHILEAFWRTTMVMRWALATHEAYEADVLITPQLPPEKEITFSNRSAIIEAGESAARDALPRIRAMLNDNNVVRSAAAAPGLSRLLCSEISEALSNPK